MDLDFEKFCLVDGSPTTVLPVLRRSSVPNSSRALGGKPVYGNDAPTLLEEFEIDFSDYCSDSWSDVRSQRVSRESSQSSQEVIQKRDAVSGRKKIEFSPRTASSFSVEIIDSLCISDEEGSVFERSRASVMSFSEQSTSSVYGNVEEEEEEDVAVSLQKSPFVTSALPRSPAKSEPDSSTGGTPKSRFNPVKKMFDPIVKSKSRRSLFSNFNEARGGTIDSIQPRRLEYDHQDEEKYDRNSVPHSSPAHLHGILEIGNKHGVLFFQFSVKSPEEIYVAKTRKVENASTWVYTFHSLPNRRKRGTKGWGVRECSSESTMVGKMHVSCHMHTEFEGAGRQPNDSMVTEFVLYDIPQSRKTTDELHPELETAAIVMQVPLEKRESLKFKSGDEKMDETATKSLDRLRLGETEEAAFDKSCSGKMLVVIPGGNHSLPSNGSCGPSPLLDRWRSGGGCDCGGWDMACPLTILTEAQRLTGSHHSTRFFVQGRKDTTIPAFTMKAAEDGKYAVDFHTQLSSLQAFSICIAVLHASDTSPIELERSKPALQSEALKVYTEEEIKTMLHEITEEGKSKMKKMEQVVPSFVLNPPSSPIALSVGFHTRGECPTGRHFSTKLSVEKRNPRGFKLYLCLVEIGEFNFST